MQQTNVGHPVMRALFFLTLIWGIAIFWIAPRPPLIDLPQHAGQVALLRDLLTGTSPWSGIFRLNLWTPYLIGYGLALPLSFIMPVGAALQVILSAAYVAFVLLGTRLRAHFGADARLDWFFLPTFFGFAYSWGFYTFLVSAPVVLLFILAVDRYALRPSSQRGMVAALIGLVLLFSHGLAFVFGAIVAGCLYTIRCYTGGGQWLKRWLHGVWPLIIPGVACIILYLISVRIQAEYWAHGHLEFVWDISIMRIPRLLANSIGDYYTPKMLLLVVMVVMLALPWLMGLRINRSNPAALVMLALVLVIGLVVPGTMIATAYVYQRFALFALPAYALIFMASLAPFIKGAKAPAPGRWARMPVMALMACVWITFACHSLEMSKFAHEAEDFEVVLSTMEPKQRVLALTFDERSEEANLDLPYRHYATWYQSEKQGLVDFNFAWFPPQMVRFRPDQLPKVMEGLKGKNFTVQKYPLDPYRYIVARHTAPLPVNLFKGADCAPRLVMTKGTWTLFERNACDIVRQDGSARLREQG
ncbi:MAG: hypothetical protein JWQ80_1409 [Massilia sp.]|nr:hypothetical protein [Massilia sp.]